jgi:hypothetical protein
VTHGGAALAFEFVVSVLARERFQPEENPHARDAARGNHQFDSRLRIHPNGRNFPHQSVCAAFDGRNVFRRNMNGIGAKSGGFCLAVQSDLFPLIVENSHQSSVPLKPHAATDVFRRRGIVRLVNFQMSVATDSAASFMKHGESIARKRHQGGAIDSVELSFHLLLRRAVNASVGDRSFPVQQVIILFGQASLRTSDHFRFVKEKDSKTPLNTAY